MGKNGDEPFIFNIDRKLGNFLKLLKPQNWKRLWYTYTQIYKTNDKKLEFFVKFSHYYKSGVQFTSLNQYGTLKVK